MTPQSLRLSLAVGGRVSETRQRKSQGLRVGVNSADDIFVRQGITKETPGGTGWKHIDGKLKQISVGKSGVWGVNAQNQIFYRTGTYDDNGSEGSGWQHVSGRFPTRNDTF